LADGLDAVASNEVDTVVIAGMGGETIAGILVGAPWLKAPNYRLILQPQSKAPELLDVLSQSGFYVLDQHLVEDAGKVYIIYEVASGQMEPPIGGARYVHERLLERGDPLLGRYLTDLCRKLRRAIVGLEQVDGMDEKRVAFTRALEDLNRWREEIVE